MGIEKAVLEKIVAALLKGDPHSASLLDPSQKRALVEDNEQLRELFERASLKSPSTDFPLFIQGMGDGMLLAIARDPYIFKLLKSSDKHKILKMVSNHRVAARLMSEAVNAKLNISPPASGKTERDSQEDSTISYRKFGDIAAHTGHVLGLTGQVMLAGSKMSLEGNEALQSFEWLKEFTDAYIASGALNAKAELNYFKQIDEAIKFMLEAFKGPDDFSEKLHHRYRSGKLIFMPTRWGRGPDDGHTVGIGIHGDYLVYSNRGEGTLNRDAGTGIYKIKDKKLITLQYIKRLRAAYQTPGEFHKVLSEVVDLNNPLVLYATKTQEHGTCSFVNPKAAIEPLLALCALYAGGPSDETQLKKIAEKNKDRTQYKDFSRFIRNKEIQNLIKLINASPPDGLVGGFFVELVNAIIAQHAGSDSRRPSKWVEERQRAVDLLKGVSPAFRERFVNAHIKSINTLIQYIVRDNQYDLFRDLMSIVDITKIPDWKYIIQYAEKTFNSNNVQPVLTLLQKNIDKPFKEAIEQGRFSDAFAMIDGHGIRFFTSCLNSLNLSQRKAFVESEKNELRFYVHDAFRDPIYAPLIDALKESGIDFNYWFERTLGNKSDPRYVREVINAGFKVKSNDVNIALYHCGQGQDISVLKVLLDSGVDITKPDDMGQTPLSVAKSLKNPALISLLEGYEAAFNSKKTIPAEMSKKETSTRPDPVIQKPIKTVHEDSQRKPLISTPAQTPQTNVQQKPHLLTPSQSQMGEGKPNSQVEKVYLDFYAAVEKSWDNAKGARTDEAMHAKTIANMKKFGTPLTKENEEWLKQNKTAVLAKLKPKRAP